MKQETVAQLHLLKSKDKFAVEEWDKRGLMPSPDAVRATMNTEVNDFIDFMESRLKHTRTSLTEAAQHWLDEWDSTAFDTEEAEFIVDVLCEVLRVVGVECSDIVI